MKRDQQKAKRDAAMPEVKKLVKKYGRTAVSSCLSRLAEYDKATRKIAELRKQAAELEKRL